MKLSEKIINLIESLKRVEFRKDGRTTDVGKNSHGLSDKTVIGWFSNKYNPAFGWSIHKLTDSEKKEFGSNAFRSLQDEKDATSIIKFDFSKGLYAFLDNKAYENGEIKFEKMSPYTKVILDDEKYAR